MKTVSSPSAAAGLALMFCALLVPAPAAAQGNGHGNAFGHNKRPSTSAPAAATSSSSSSSGGSGSVDAAIAPIPEGSGIRNFGSWLDDASIMTPGSGFASFAAGYWRTAGFTELDVPAFDVGVGLTPRIQFGASVPVYHAREPGGAVSRGIGDLFLHTKIQLRDPAASRNRIGFALVPVVEVLSVAPASGASRLAWGLPAAVELQRDGWRVYGSAGYFSRGAVFGSGAIEIGVGKRTWVTGTISESRSIKDDAYSEALGLSSTRRDISGGAAVLVSDAMSVFGNVGRTISARDWNSATLFVTGGVAVNFTAWTR